MKSFIRLTDYKKNELLEIFRIADSIKEYEGFLTRREQFIPHLYRWWDELR